MTAKLDGPARRALPCIGSIVAIACALTIAAPARSLAQVRTPDTGMVAIGGDIGIFLPSDDALDSTLTFGGLVEYYVGPRFSIRGSLFWKNPGREIEPEDTLEQTRLGIDGVYNWEGGKIHPFAGAGFGIHFLSLQDNDREIADDTDPGFAVLGGLEYFLDRRNTIKGELRYEWVGDILGVNPDGLSLTVGLKHYFGGTPPPPPPPKPRPPTRRRS